MTYYNSSCPVETTLQLISSRDVYKRQTCSLIDEAWNAQTYDWFPPMIEWVKGKNGDVYKRQWICGMETLPKRALVKKGTCLLKGIPRQAVF